MRRKPCCVRQKMRDYWQNKPARVWLCASLHARRPNKYQLGKFDDLDVETLRALEDALLEFAGCVAVISHDRWFLDRIATHILACEGDSKWTFFDGNYQEYEADKKNGWVITSDLESVVCSLSRMASSSIRRVLSLRGFGISRLVGKLWAISDRAVLAM